MALFKKQYKPIKKTTLAAEIVKIKNDPNTAFVEFNKSKTVITIVTKNLKNYGGFFIIFRLKRVTPNTAIHIHSGLIGGKKHDSPHPHISCISGICFGNIHSDIEKGLRLKRYYLVYNYIIELLSHPNYEDPFLDYREYSQLLKYAKNNMRKVRI